MQKDVVSALRFAGFLTASDALDALERRQDIEQLLLLMHAGALRFKSSLSESPSTDVKSLNLDSVIVAHLLESGFETITGLHVTGPEVLHGLRLRDLRKAIQQLAAKGIFIGASDHFAKEGPWRTSHVTLEEAVTRCESAEVFAALIDSMTDQNTRFLPPNGRRSVVVDLDGSLNELPFRQRTHNALQRAGILSVRNLLHVRAADLMDIRNFGFNSLQDVVRVLEICGLWFEKEPSTGIQRTEAVADGPSHLDLALRYMRTTEGIRLDHLASNLNLSVPELRSLLAAHYGLKPSNKAGLRSNIRAEFLMFQRQRNDRTGSDSRKPDENDDSTDPATRLARLYDDQDAPAGRELGGNTLVELLLAALQEHPNASTREIGEQFGLSGLGVEQLLCRHFNVLEEDLPAALAAHQLVVERSLTGVDLNAQILAFIKEDGCISIRAVSDAAEVEDDQAITYLVSQLLGLSATRRRQKRFIEKRMREMHQVFREEQRQSQKQSAKDARIAAMLELRLEGHTLDEIGSNFGITRERVRQLLKREFGQKTSHKELRQHRLHREIDEISDRFSIGEIRFPLDEKSSDFFRRFARSPEATQPVDDLKGRLQKGLQAILLASPGMTDSEVEERTGLDFATIKIYVPSHAGRLVILDSDQRSKKSGVTNDEIIQTLKLASTYHFPLTGKKYDALIASGEISGVSKMRIMQRFGSWTEACRLAGVESGEPLRQDYKRTWSHNDLVEFVVEYLSDPTSTGQRADWRRWLAEDSTRPSEGTMRNQLGEWPDIKHDVLRSTTFRERINE